MKDLKISIKVDSNTRELKSTNSQLKNLNTTVTKSADKTKVFQKRLETMAHAGAGVYFVDKAFEVLNATIGQTVRTGIGANREMENLTNSLATLNAATSANTDSTGKALTITEKYAIATKEAAVTMNELFKINAKTPHTFNQTVALYDSMYIGMKKLGASSEEMIGITEKLSIAVGTKVEFSAMLSAMDGLSTGTVEVSSEMGRFLRAIGLSNEAIKESTDVVGLFDEKLSDFKAIDSFDTKLSNLNNSWTMFAKNLSEPLFNTVSDNLKPFASVIDQMNLGLSRVRAQMSEVKDLHKEEDLIYKRQLLIKERKVIQDDKFMWDSEQKRETTRINKELQLLSSKMAGIYTDKANQQKLEIKLDVTDVQKDIQTTLNPYQVELGKINEKWLKHYELLEKNKASTTELVKAWNKDVLTLNDKYSGVGKDTDNYDAHVKAYEEMLEKKKSAQDEFSQGYYESTLSAFDNERLQISQQYDEYRNYVTDKTKLEEWFVSRLAEVNDQELEQVKRSNEEKINIQKRFSESYNQSIMSQYDFERSQLKVEYQEFDKVVKNKRDLSAWYQNELSIINDKEAEDFKEKELEKREASDNWLFGAQDAMQDYVKSASDSYLNASNVFTNAMTSMEDSLVSLATNGKLEFASLRDSIISDMTRMMIRKNIMAPMMSGLGSMLGGFAFENGGIMSSKGEVPLRAYANGGIASSPQLALYGEGRQNEAYIPLPDNRTVPVTLTVPQSQQPAVTKFELHIENKTSTAISGEQISAMTKTDANGEQTKVVNMVLDAVGRNKNGARDNLRGLMR